MDTASNGLKDDTARLEPGPEQSLAQPAAEGKPESSTSPSAKAQANGSVVCERDFPKDEKLSPKFAKIEPNGNETSPSSPPRTLAETLPRGRDAATANSQATATQSERPLFPGSFSAELSRARTDSAQFQRTALVGLGRVIAREKGVTEPSIGAYSPAKLANIDELNQIAKAFGKEIIGFKQNSIKSEIKDAFGFFNGESVGGDMNDLIFISRDNQHPHLSLLGHELVHTLRRESSALYNELVNAVNVYTKTGYYKANFGKEAVARYLTEDDAIREEFMGEVLSDGFTNVHFWNAVGAKSPTLLDRIIGALGQLIDRVRTTFGEQRRTEKYLTDFDAVMRLAGGVMAKYGAPQINSQNAVPKYSRTIFQGQKQKWLLTAYEVSAPETRKSIGSSGFADATSATNRADGKSVPNIHRL